MQMKVMTAKEAKNAFGTFIDTAQREPVFVTKRKRMVGVFLSIQDVESIPELKEMMVDYMDARAKSPLLSMLGANKDNQVFTSPAEADQLINELRNEWKA